MKLFNGHYTVTNPKGEHRTFRIATQPLDASFAPGERLLGLLSGPENEENYKTFAFVNEDDTIRVWARFKSKTQEKSFWEKSAFMLRNMVLEGDQSPFVAKGCSLLLEKHCLACNRLLTIPESIERGIGPECAKKFGAIKKNRVLVAE